MEEPFADPAAMTPHERRREIAAILARGVLRLRQAAQTCPGSRFSRTPENPAREAKRLHEPQAPFGLFRKADFDVPYVRVLLDLLDQVGYADSAGDPCLKGHFHLVLGQRLAVVELGEDNA